MRAWVFFAHKTHQVVWCAERAFLAIITLYHRPSAPFASAVGHIFFDIYRVFTTPLSLHRPFLVSPPGIVEVSRLALVWCGHSHHFRTNLPGAGLFLESLTKTLQPALSSAEAHNFFFTIITRPRLTAGIRTV